MIPRGLQHFGLLRAAKKNTFWRFYLLYDDFSVIPLFSPHASLHLLGVCIVVVYPLFVCYNGLTIPFRERGGIYSGPRTSSL